MDVGKASDGMLDKISALREARGDAVNMLFNLILENPELDAGLSAVVHRLEATK